MLTLCPRRLNIISLFAVFHGIFPFKFKPFRDCLGGAQIANSVFRSALLAVGQDKWRSIS